VYEEKKLSTQTSKEEGNRPVLSKPPRRTYNIFHFTQHPLTSELIHSAFSVIHCNYAFYFITLLDVETISPSLSAQQVELQSLTSLRRISPLACFAVQYRSPECILPQRYHQCSCSSYASSLPSMLPMQMHIFTCTGVRVKVVQLEQALLLLLHHPALR